jgi:MFS family permease
MFNLQLGILARTFPPSRARSLAFASFSAGAPIGAAFGTVIGGILTEKTTYDIFPMLEKFPPYFA